MHDLIIIGGGPAGVSAGVYSARKQLKTLLITLEFGGQSVVSPDIQNWIGTPSISGTQLAKNFEEHLNKYAGEFLKIKKEKVEKIEEGFVVNKKYKTKSVLIATGSNRRKLDVKGADEFEHKGLTYCATCDGPLFSGQDVVVIGGGNAGFETSAQLLAYAKSVTLLEFENEYKADAITVEKVLSHPNMKGITEAKVTEIKGNKFVNGLVYEKSGKKNEISVGGIFVEIGAVPVTGFVSNLVELNEYKQIVVDPWTQRTSMEGIWSAGDCTNGKYHQNNIAAGDAVKALEDIYLWLKTK